MTKRKVHRYVGGFKNRMACGRPYKPGLLYHYLGGPTEVTCLSCLSGGASNTEAQVKAKARNWKIRMLKGIIYHANKNMSPTRARQVVGIVSAELHEMGYGK